MSKTIDVKIKNNEFSILMIILYNYMIKMKLNMFEEYLNTNYYIFY